MVEISFQGAGSGFCYLLWEAKVAQTWLFFDLPGSKKDDSPDIYGHTAMADQSKILYIFIRW